MAESPAHARNPGCLRAAHRQRGDGRQMVRAGQHVNEAGNQSGDGCNHKLAAAKLPEFPVRRKENSAAIISFFSIRFARECSHTLIDENRPFSAASATFKSL